METLCAVPIRLRSCAAGATWGLQLVGETVADFSNGPLCLKPRYLVTHATTDARWVWIILSKSCWLHPRKTVPVVGQGPGGVTTSPTLLGPVLMWSRQNCMDCWKPWGFSRLLRPTAPAFPIQRKSGYENKWVALTCRKSWFYRLSRKLGSAPTAASNAETPVLTHLML